MTTDGIDILIVLAGKKVNKVLSNTCDKVKIKD